MTVTQRRLKPSRFAASSSVFGSMIASSQRMQATTPMMLVIEVKSARNPKASGPYRRVRSGGAGMVPAWARVR
jgi:hypothetical protein